MPLRRSRLSLVLQLTAASLAGVAPAAHAQGPALQALTVFPPPALQQAIAKGTRAANGAPGPKYWQNGANYDIKAEITLPDSLLRGDETVRYFNRSPDTLRTMYLHLYQNLFARGAERENVNGWTTAGLILERFEINGHAMPIPRSIAGEPAVLGLDTVRTLGTILRTSLPKPILPGDSATLKIQWRFTIPPQDADRMGMQDSATAQIAQWYPQVAVYDDVHGWDFQRYTGTGEFYLDYGRFTYSVTLPAGFLVAGTGTLANPAQVLPQSVRDALSRAAQTDSITRPVAANGFGPGRATAGRPGDRLTWTFNADSVRDVAFSFSDHYVWEATRALVDAATKRMSLVHILYRPGAAGYGEVAKMARSALESHSRRMVPYPYPQLTQTEGGAGGMEYPMTVFVQAYKDTFQLDGVTAHEIGHEWFPMLVGSNETRYGWQDEGLNTFDTFFATDDYFRTTNQDRGRKEAQDGYVKFVQQNDEDFPMMAPANAFGVSTASGYGSEAYDKPGTALWALRTTLGAELFNRAYTTYIRRWSFRHPTPWDFFSTFNDVTHQNLDWFWKPWFFGRDRLDQAIVSVTMSGNRASVVVENKGGLYAPIDLTATLADGSTVSWQEPASVWFNGTGRITSTHDVGKAITSVTIDAAMNFPDVDRSNNTWKKP